MKISTTRLSPSKVHTKEERAVRRRAAYSFLLSEIKSIYGDITSEGSEGEASDPDIFPFRKDPLGKPYLEGYPQILFNLSHSRNGYAAAVVEDAGQALSVGIDIEFRFPYNELLARKICHVCEAEALQYACSEEERKDLLNFFWSRKEALLKCEGTGIRSSLKSLDTVHIDKRRYEIFEKQTDEYTLVVCKKRISLR